MSTDPESARQARRSQRRYIKHRLAEVEMEVAGLLSKHQDCIPRPVVEQVSRQYVLLMGSSHVSRIPARFLSAENLIVAGREGYSWRDAIACLSETKMSPSTSSCRPRNRSLRSMTSADAVVKASIIVLVYGTNDISYFTQDRPIPVNRIIKQMRGVLDKIRSLRSTAKVGPAQIHVSSVMPRQSWNAHQLEASVHLDRAALHHVMVTSLVPHPWYDSSCHLIEDGKHLTEAAYQLFAQDLKAAVRHHRHGDW